MKRDAIVPVVTDSPLSNLAHFGFLILPNFSMIAFTSNGITIKPMTTLDEAGPDVLIVCAGGM